MLYTSSSKYIPVTCNTFYSQKMWHIVDFFTDVRMIYPIAHLLEKQRLCFEAYKIKYPIYFDTALAFQPLVVAYFLFLQSKNEVLYHLFHFDKMQTQE